MGRCVGGLIAVILLGLLQSGAARAQDDLDSFWQRGRVRELFISGLPADEAALQGWAQVGVNCVTGVKPELAHAQGLKTRTWFTMNMMSSRNMDEATIKSMSAVREDGSYLRPYDPLFPTVGQYGWSACINNPAWIAHSRAVFTKMAHDGYDGCHIDYASHYEPCFCEHCRAKWAEWAQGHGLEATDLSAASRAADPRTAALLREFRIHCVMDFLGDLRATARAVRPGFATDGTWHQDSGSTYQWAYGEHFDLMCIEGTTFGPFPPAGTQVPWMKLAHALSRRPDRRPVAMSVTYHLLPDAEGKVHHGRMAADRVRVALAEILSQGGVSWLGLGGPGTGNLLREHQEVVRAYFALARDLEPLLVAGEDLAEIGLVFSPRSFLLSGQARTELYALGQAMMHGHVPFTILSDVDLRAADLSRLSGVVVLSAPALSDAACSAIEDYARQGGKVLVIGRQTATVGADWQPRVERPFFAISPEGSGVVEKTVGRGRCWYWSEEQFAGKRLGAVQTVQLDQDRPAKLAVEGWSKAEDVAGHPGGDYSVYVDLVHQDGTPLWGQTAQFRTGTHDWEFSRTVIESDRPFRSARLHLLFRNRPGTAWFRDVRFGVWDEEKQQIVENLLGSRLRTPDGQVHGAVSEDQPQGFWEPYGDGYEVENMLDLGLWAKMASTTGVQVGDMHSPDAASVGNVLEVLAPLRAPRPLVTVTGEGADRVFADLSRAGDRVLLQLINYAAELHPDLPELEQQQADRSLPARDLQVRLRFEGEAPSPGAVRVLFPEDAPAGAPAHEVRPTEDGLAVHIESLAQWCAIVVGGD